MLGNFKTKNTFIYLPVFLFFQICSLPPTGRPAWVPSSTRGLMDRQVRCCTCLQIRDFMIVTLWHSGNDLVTYALLVLLFKIILNSVGIEEKYKAFSRLKINIMEKRMLRIHLGKKSNNWAQRERSPLVICYVGKRWMQNQSSLQPLFLEC